MDGTTQLLLRWGEGDQAALSEVLRLHQGYVREQARKLLGKGLREKLTSEDVVQTAMLEFLRYGPRFIPESGAQFRKLLARIVANAIADQGQWFQAARRHMAQETTFEEDVHESSDDTDPVASAHQNELRDRLRMAMELLSEGDRRILVLRNWEKLTFPEIAAQLDSTQQTVRSAYRRAVERLQWMMKRLRRDGLDAAMDAELD